MPGGIFISYRRDDAKHAAGRLVDRLSRTFRSEQLFLDIDNIEPGLDFVKVLREKVQACDVLLAVIGPGWLSSRDESGVRRLDNPKDFVRIEIEVAMARDVRVIPVLVDGAHMPREEDLPIPLKPLSNRQAVRLVHERFGSDADDLTRALTTVVSPAKSGWFGAALGEAARAGLPAVEKPHANVARTGPPPVIVVFSFIAGIVTVHGFDFISGAAMDPLSKIFWTLAVFLLVAVFFDIVRRVKER